MSGEERSIDRVRSSPHGRWYWHISWDDGDDWRHGLGGWSWTKVGARLAMQLESRREAAAMRKFFS